jgi:hypothetical protein
MAVSVPGCAHGDADCRGSHRWCIVHAVADHPDVTISSEQFADMLDFLIR